MSDPIHRREALRQLAIFSVTAFVPATLAACKGKPSCLDVTGLSGDEVNQRQNIAAYAEPALDPAKKCSGCVQYVAGAPNACATCKVVKGPVSPDGGCKLFTAKPA